MSSLQVCPRIASSTQNLFAEESVDDLPEGAYTYALVKTAPEVPAEECEASIASLEVSVRWGASVLALTHLTPPRSFYVGEQTSRTETVDCALPAEILGATRAPIVLADDNGFASIVILPGATGTLQVPGQPVQNLADAMAAGRARPCDAVRGAQQIALPAGARARIQLGEVAIEVAAVNAGRVVAPRFDLDTKALPFHGVSALVHLGLLAAAVAFMPALGNTSEDDAARDQQYLMQQYLAASAERETPERPDALVADAAERAAEGGQGTKAKGASGSMGDPMTTKTGGRFGVGGAPDNKDVRIGRDAALEDASKFGMVGILNVANAGYRGPTAAWGDVDPSGNDALSARGNMWGESIDDAAGAGGLGLAGIGEGGDGRGEGIGLGSLGTIGHGSGRGDGQGFGPGFGSSHGRGRGTHASTVPMMRAGATSVVGRIPAEVIQRIVRQNFGRFRGCYESALRRDPGLAGRVAVSFVIGRDGSVSSAKSGGSDLPDAGVVSCVVRSFYGLSFPQPEGGIVTVTYPIVFTPAQ